MLTPDYYTDKKKYESLILSTVFENVENMAAKLDEILAVEGRDLNDTDIKNTLTEFSYTHRNNLFVSLKSLFLLREYWERDGSGDRLTDQHEVFALAPAVTIETLIA